MSVVCDVSISERVESGWSGSLLEGVGSGEMDFAEIPK